jgi:hypothetical protein
MNDMNIVDETIEETAGVEPITEVVGRLFCLEKYKSYI